MPQPAKTDDLDDLRGGLKRASANAANLGDKRPAKEISDGFAKAAGVPSVRAAIQRVYEIIAEQEQELSARAVAEDDSA